MPLLTILLRFFFFFFFCFNATATTEIYTLSLHDALPICRLNDEAVPVKVQPFGHPARELPGVCQHRRSEEHTSELQSHHDLVCRLLLEKKKNNTHTLKTKNRTSCVAARTWKKDDSGE